MSTRQAVEDSLRLLPIRDRRRVAVSATVQMGLSFLDLLGVLTIGLAVAVSVAVVEGAPLPAVVTTIASALGLSVVSDTTFVAILVLLAAGLLLTKSAASAVLMRRILRFLATRQALLAQHLADQLLTTSATTVRSRSTQEVAYALIQGTASVTVLILGQAVVLASELSLLLVVSIGLLVLDPLVALLSVAYFTGCAVGIHFLIAKRASRVGAESAAADIASLDIIQESINGFREIVVLGRTDFYIQRIAHLRARAGRALADLQYLGMVPKYAFEVALVVGAVLLGLVLFSTQPAAVAAGTLALFVAAASRVMPSLLRIQGALVGIRGASAMAEPTVGLIKDLEDHGAPRPLPRAVELAQDPGRDASDSSDVVVRMEDVGFAYPNASELAVRDVSLAIRRGDSLALVGPSGAGKSTIADLMLGLIAPTYGSVTVEGMDPRDFVRHHPGAIAYVPQSPVMSTQSVRRNVALGLNDECVSDAEVWRALEMAHLSDVVSKMGRQLDAPIGEGATQLSGGQRQRLGLARALLSQPELLILDEATSALDVETEAELIETLRGLHGIVTVLVIAHRLSTVRGCKRVAYIEHGRLVGEGDWDSMRGKLAHLQEGAQHPEGSPA